MRLFPSIIIAGMLVAACGDRQSSTAGDSQNAPALSSGSPATSASPSPASTASAAAAPASVATPSESSRSNTSSAPAPAIAGRTGELVNPDDHAMVFLYLDLAGIQPPLDQWVDQDFRVSNAKAFDKAAVRATVRGELEAAAAAVRGVGFIRVTMNASLSDYDPTYEEFTVGALSPGSTVNFSARGHKVSLRFANGRVAQMWRVPPAEAQVVRDKIGGYGSHASLDALLRIISIQPGYAGGTITTEVIEYEMRSTRNGMMIGRVQVAR